MVHCVTCLLVVLGALPAEPDSSSIESRTKVRSQLEQARDAAARTGQVSDQIAMLKSALQQARDASADNVLVVELCDAVLAKPSPTADELRSATNSVLDILSFRYRKEAELPEGFPQPTPVGVIQLKSYPAYRLARVKSDRDSAFFTLFTHISTSRIEMTAPVEMNARPAGPGKPPETSDMAFLYGSPKIGSPGRKLGGVTVEDVPARTTVCIGLKGEDNREKLQLIEQRLEKWLATNATEYVRDGDLRVMGYNSPAVRRSESFWEVEFNVRPKEPKPSAQ